MSLLDEVIAKGLEWFNRWRYSIPRLPYADADFTRNLWIISMKKGIREVIKAHKPYTNPKLITDLSAMLNKAIMKLYSFPELKSYYDMKIDTEYTIAKYGYYKPVTVAYGMGSRQRLLTMGMP